MKTNKNTCVNNLWITRRRLRLSQKQIARLLGHKSTVMLSKYEHGERPPPLVIALKLAIIYKSSIEELFPGLRRELITEVLRAQLKN